MHAFYQQPVLSIETFILRIGSAKTFLKRGLTLIKFWSNFGLIFPKNHVWFRSEIKYLKSDFTIGSTAHEILTWIWGYQDDDWLHTLSKGWYLVFDRG